MIAGSGAAGLRDAVLLLCELGSLTAQHLQPSSHWVWVFVKGGRTIVESVVIGSVSPVRTMAQFSFAPFDQHYYGNPLEQKRWELCQQADGLGNFCDERNLDTVRPRAFPLPDTEILDNVPVIVTGGFRLPYLSVTIRSLLTSPGVRKQNIEVFLGDTSDSVVKFLELLDVKYTKIPVSGQGNSKLFQYYRSVYAAVAQKYNSSTAVIFLDEDVEVSPDFFSLMSQMIPYLLKDESLYCVSGHSSAQGSFLEGKLDMVKRVATPVIWGYALTIKFIKETLAHWPTDRKFAVIYDHWMFNEVADYRECIVPEVSRTKHFGAGLNTLGTDLENFFLSMDLPQQYGVKIKNLKDIPFKSWVRYTRSEIEKSKVIYGDPCNKSTLRDLEPGSYVFPYTLEIAPDGTYDIENYFLIGECLDFWAQSDQGWHAGVTEIRLKNNVLVFFIAVPFSPFHKYAKIDHNKIFNVKKNRAMSRQVLNKITASRYKVFNDIARKYQNSRPVLDLFKKN